MRYRGVHRRSGEQGRRDCIFSGSHESVEVLPIFNVALTRNRGMSFGLFTGLPWWTLSFLGAHGSHATIRMALAHPHETERRRY